MELSECESLERKRANLEIRFGKPGVLCDMEVPSKERIVRLAFVVNKGRLIAMTETSLFSFDFSGAAPSLLFTFEFKREEFVCIHFAAHVQAVCPHAACRLHLCLRRNPTWQRPCFQHGNVHTLRLRDVLEHAHAPVRLLCVAHGRGERGAPGAIVVLEQNPADCGKVRHVHCPSFTVSQQCSSFLFF